MGAWKAAVCAAVLHIFTSTGVAAETDARALPPDAAQDTTAVPAPAALAEDPTTPPQPTPTDTLPGRSKTGLYVHAGGGAGFGFMSSDAITDLFGDEFTIGIGLHFSASVAVGYRNLVQLEARVGDSSHTLRNNNIVTQVTTEIPMDYDFTEYVVKANLFGLTSGGRRGGQTALFVVVGAMQVEYLDEAKDGFKGGGTVFGLEIMRMAPNGAVTASLGLRRYGIEFDEITLAGQTIPVAADASNYVLHTALTVGLGL